MSHIIDLVLKDWMQIARDKKSFGFLLLMPVVFTLFFGMIPWAGEPGADTRPRVVLIAADEADAAGAALFDLLQGLGTVRAERYDGGVAEANEAVSRGEVAAAVVVPVGFEAALWADSDPLSPLTIIADEQTQTGHAARAAVQVAGLRLLGAVDAARIASTASDRSDLQAMRGALAQVVDAWADPPLTVLATRSAPTDPFMGGNPYEQASPGMMVQFVIFGLMQAGMVLVLERKGGTMQRLLTTPITRGQVIAAKLLAIFGVVMLQQVILMAVGQFALGVGYLREPLAALLLMLVFAFWASALGLLIGSVAREEEQVIGLTMVAMFLLSAMGGAWFPLEVAGETFSTIGRLLPSAWAMIGLQNIVVRGLGVPSVFAPVAIMAGYGLLFFGLAVWRFRFE